jgi:hypothetical protein
MNPETPGRPGIPVPSTTCAECGEFLPHWCAPEITISRAKWTGRRVIHIRDRQITARGNAQPDVTCDMDREAG